MKFFLLLILASPVIAAGQTTEAYYDYNWKRTSKDKAQYLSLVEKTDSGWYRRDFFIYNRQVVRRGLYKDSGCNVINGNVLMFYPNGNLMSTERRIKGKLEGLRLQYHFNGMMADSGFYQNHKQIGVRLQWHRNGYTGDSTNRINDSTLTEVQWFDDGTPAAAGYMVNDRKQGRWQYFHRNGKQAGLIVYDKDKAISQTYYNEDGSPQPDTAAANREAVFKKKGVEGWINYLTNNNVWPRGYKLANTSQVSVVVQFCVDENGKIKDAEVVLPFDPVFDKEALKIIQQSPAWLPAIQHNRSVKAWRRQPITFVQQE